MTRDGTHNIVILTGAGISAESGLATFRAADGLWEGHRDGAVVALFLLPVEAVFWWGFALPIPPVVALVRTALILGWWRQVR